ncbi:MAG: zinc ribbon domain-containing protein [Actinobacteria bacterium]|nr:zinc ribbon domain-containing protein [Actinomycetota bacterium]
MPIYEYRCVKCANQFERLVSSGTDPNAASCPSCGAPEPKRLVSVISGMGGGAEPSAPVCGDGACESCS